MTTGTRVITDIVSVALLAGAMSSIGGSIGAAQEHAQPAAAKTRKPPAVLFMCPHGAAKSVLASAYFQRTAKERGLNVRVLSGGTDPDPAIAPAVARHLALNGYEVPTAKPRMATRTDIEDADVVVSLGCDLKNLPVPPGKLKEWNDVPAPSEDFSRADEAIKKRVGELVDEFIRAAKTP